MASTGEGHVASSSSPSSVHTMPTTVQGRVDMAKALKMEGNELFERHEWKKAIKKYCHATMFSKGIMDKLDFIPGLESAAGRLKPTEEQKKEAINVMVAVTNNLAACLSHMEKWDRVVSRTNEVLKLRPDNCKALYRRGVARFHLDFLDEAEEDLTAANRINPKDKNVKEKLQEVYEQLRGRKQKEKAMYQAMFNTAS